MKVMTRKQISLQISRILKENNFSRLAGRWDSNKLHIGVHPKGFYAKDFSSEKALEDFKNAIQQINSLQVVEKAESAIYAVDWRSMAGIKIDVNI